MSDQVFAIAHTFQSGAEATGNGTVMDVGGLAEVGVQVEGITNATVTFEATIDGSTWYAIRTINVTDGSVASAVTADALVRVPVAGMDKLRARISAYVGGTITVTGKGVVATAPPLAA